MVIPTVDYTPNRPPVNHELEPAEVRWRFVAQTRPVRLCAGCRTSTGRNTVNALSG
jgi:hypothetical protein